VTQLDLAGLAASSGAACSAIGQEPSHVLPALGLDDAAVAGSLRLSLGWSTTAAEIDEAAATVASTARMLLDQRPMRL
jgi:cysteine desulfurase